MQSAYKRAVTANKKRVLLLVFSTAFLDLMGFSVIFPLFPQMLDYYADAEGPGSRFVRFLAWLESLAGDTGNSKFLVMVLFGGLLGSLYSGLQFLFAPVWGALSDRLGRRPTLLLTLAGTALGYIGWIFAGKLWILVVARMIGGMMAGNIAIVSAVVADVTTAENRSKGMGLIGAAIGLGFILGPAFGGISTFFDLRHIFEGGAAYGLNPFSCAALISFVLASLNWILAVTTFPETKPPTHASEAPKRTNNPMKLFRGVSAPGVQRINLIAFLFLTAFSAMEFSLTFLAVERFSFTPRDNAWMFVFVGFVVALVQGGAIRALAPRFGDKKLAFYGLVVLVPGLLAIGLSPSILVLYLGLGGLAVGSALATPSLSALISKYAPESQQGLALGLFRSMSALSRAVGPVVGGLFFWQAGPVAAYGAAALVVAIPAYLVLGLPEPSNTPPT